MLRKTDSAINTWTGTSACSTVHTAVSLTSDSQAVRWCWRWSLRLCQTAQTPSAGRSSSPATPRCLLKRCPAWARRTRTSAPALWRDRLRPAAAVSAGAGSRPSSSPQTERFSAVSVETPGSGCFEAPRAERRGALEARGIGLDRQLLSHSLQSGRHTEDLELPSAMFRVRCEEPKRPERHRASSAPSWAPMQTDRPGWWAASGASLTDPAGGRTSGGRF